MNSVEAYRSAITGKPSPPPETLDDLMALLDLADRIDAGTATAQETRLALAKLIRRMVRQ